MFYEWQTTSTHPTNATKVLFIRKLATSDFQILSKSDAKLLIISELRNISPYFFRRNSFFSSKGTSKKSTNTTKQFVEAPSRKAVHTSKVQTAVYFKINHLTFATPTFVQMPPLRIHAQYYHNCRAARVRRTAVAIATFCDTTLRRPIYMCRLSYRFLQRFRNQGR